MDGVTLSVECSKKEARQRRKYTRVRLLQSAEAESDVMRLSRVPASTNIQVTDGALKRRLKQDSWGVLNVARSVVQVSVIYRALEMSECSL